MRPLLAGDRIIGSLIVIATIAYLAALPRYLGWADESYFLYEAKRIRDGEVMYRDIFQFITPLASYVMALLFSLFGTTIATARIAMAVLHAALCALLYAIPRRLAVRRSFALLGPLAFLALCQPTWPFASPHWFATALTIAVLAVLICPHGIDGPGSRVPRPALSGNPGLGTRDAGLLLGVLVGMLIAVQQQKGAIIAGGVIGILLADRGLDARYGRARVRSLFADLTRLIAGAALIVVPLALYMIGTAGVAPVYRALILFPLDSYRHGHYIRWGATAPLAESFSAATSPLLLRWAPLSMAIPLIASVAGMARRDNERATRQHMVLVVLGISSVVSIWYFPDLIHIAFIAPIFLVCAVASIEWVFQRLCGQTRTAGLSVIPANAGIQADDLINNSGDATRHSKYRAKSSALVAETNSLDPGFRRDDGRARPKRALAQLTTVVLTAALGYQLWHNTVGILQEYSIPHETAFGRIDFAQPWEPMMVDAVRSLLNDVPGRELFSYPNVTSIYLTAGAHNPTPYQYLLARVSPPWQIAEAERILTAHRLPYVIVAPTIFTTADPLARFITEHYESAPIQQIVDAGQLPAFWLYRRKADADAR